MIVLSLHAMRECGPGQATPVPAEAARGEASAKATGHHANSEVARSKVPLSVRPCSNGRLEGRYAPHEPTRLAATVPLPSRAAVPEYSATGVGGTGQPISESRVAGPFAVAEAHSRALGVDHKNL